MSYICMNNKQLCPRRSVCVIKAKSDKYGMHDVTEMELEYFTLCSDYELNWIIWQEFLII